VLTIALGFWMHDLAENGVVNDGLFRAYQLHKSIGLTVLALSLARLGWRLLNPPPPLPAAMPAWERIAAAATHWAFYALMIALPLSGWTYVSAGWSIHENAALAVETRWFGLFTVPHLFGLDQASEATRASAAETALRAHWLLAWGALLLLALHVAAALKHQFVDRDGVMARMIPGLRNGGDPAPRNPLRLAVLGSGLSAAAAALVAVGLAWSDMASDATAAGAASAPAPITASAPRGPNAWVVDAARSSIGWSFTYSDSAADQRFNGRFTQWAADITFDPANLAASNVLVRIAAASATDGVSLHDRTLPTAEWFNAAAHPHAEFRTSRIAHLGGDNYRAEGQLTLRGQTRPVILPFTLRIDGRRAVMDGRVSLDRRAFGVGAGTDADDSISAAVDVVVHVEADRAS
jgi:cytochrome b561